LNGPHHPMQSRGPHRLPNCPCPRVLCTHGRTYRNTPHDFVTVCMGIVCIGVLTTGICSCCGGSYHDESFILQWPKQQGPGLRAVMMRRVIPRRDFVIANSVMTPNSGGSCIHAGVFAAVKANPAVAASLLRLAFHDAATGRGGRGANGSVKFELERTENVGPSLRLAVDTLRPLVHQCGVGWADAIAVAGAAAVEATGGPSIKVGLGRADAQKPDPEGLLPNPGFTGRDVRLYFQQRGMTDEEAVAMLGAHTLGRWTSFLGVSKECMAKSEADASAFWTCTREEGTRLPFTTHPESFNNEYFKALVEFYKRRAVEPKPQVRWKYRKPEGLPRLNLLPSDNAVVFDDALRPIVQRFADDESAFFDAFSRGYQKLVGSMPR